MFSKLLIALCAALVVFPATALNQSPQVESSWHLSQSNHTPRHEANVVMANKQVFLLGGRGKKAIEQYDTDNNVWLAVGDIPAIELHHFQAVTVDINRAENNPDAREDRVFLVGAFTGAWPNEEGISYVLTFNPYTFELSQNDTIPEKRRRGAAASAVYNNKIYLVGGSTHGHMSGTTTWFDEFDPVTGSFTVLPDAPIARDHAQAAVVGSKLFVLSGRKTARATGDDFNLTTKEVDMYDFISGEWETLPASANIPTPRAGANAVVIGKYIVLMGGESAAQKSAHSQVEAFNTRTYTWHTLPNLQRGRHSGGAVYINGRIIAVTGSGNRGGSPELDSVETIDITESDIDTAIEVNVKKQTYSNLETSVLKTVNIDINGPNVDETSWQNPFTHYLSHTTIIDESGDTLNLRGYFAADGKAQFSSASEGNVWRTKYTPSVAGNYRYKTTLYSGNRAAFADTKSVASLNLVTQQSGVIKVHSAKREHATAFVKTGFLKIKNGYFYSEKDQTYWLKIGSNSPENMLAYWQFDNTYRHAAQAREGEANTAEGLHEFAAHIDDWQLGDPLWGTDKSKGKGLIGAVNYIASQGLNVQYFLTLNIDGDGRDVWPYINHRTFDRFDVSKLAQWNLVFGHMQEKGIMLHIVTQETENERMLNDGNMGDMRKLYYLELIARFAHHKALVWNLGEENGPANFSPNGQDDEQRYAMATFFAQNDPYKHPIMIHSHSTPESKDEILTPLLKSDYDGISFQVNERTNVFEEISKWRMLSSGNGTPWLISMDEIGKWYIGAMTDEDDPKHDSLRQHVLWPSFMAGAAGVEWYAGAHQAHNDLGLEDFRTRQNLWRQSKIAKDFLAQYVGLDELRPAVPIKDILLAQREYNNSTYTTVQKPAASQYTSYSQTQFLAYLIKPTQLSGSMPNGVYTQVWLNPVSGQKRRMPDLSVSQGSFTITFNSAQSEQDWVLLLSVK